MPEHARAHRQHHDADHDAAEFPRHGGAEQQTGQRAQAQPAEEDGRQQHPQRMQLSEQRDNDAIENVFGEILHEVIMHTQDLNRAS